MLFTPRRKEDGSVAITMMVMVIVTGLTTAMLTTVFRNIRATRTAGDQANALQVADAGVNEAVRSVRGAVGAVNTCPNYPSLEGFIRTGNIAGGTYTYCAAKDTDVVGRTIWHIDATGQDQTGDKRRLRVDAVAEPMFPNAIHVMSVGDFGNNFSVDSYRDETNRCTRKGKIGTNDPATFQVGNNNGNQSDNCQDNPNGAFPYVADGCVAFSRNGDQLIPAAEQGNGHCPPLFTTTESPEFTIPSPQQPATYDALPLDPIAGEPWDCSAAVLQPGKVYFAASVNLRVGCGVSTTGVSYPAMANPVKLYTTSLTITGATGNGQPNEINPPPQDDTGGACGATHTVATYRYCPGWPGALQIYVIGSNPVTFNGNHAKFWGVIQAPNAPTSWGNGGPQWEVWGAMIASSLNAAGGGGGNNNVGVSAMWHFDENLGTLNTGRYFPENWREEGLSAP